MYAVSNLNLFEQQHPREIKIHERKWQDLLCEIKTTLDWFCLTDKLPIVAMLSSKSHMTGEALSSDIAFLQWCVNKALLADNCL